jgi:stage III sporulation protein SpoIIIAA
MQRTITDDLDLLLDALPPHISAPLRDREDNQNLLEIVLDLGRLPSARYPGREAVLGNTEVTQADIDAVVAHIGEFGDDNRAGIERTLHRISAIRNRAGNVVGLTCRVGRAVFGTIQLIDDLVQSGKSILLLGKPGVGKTTMLRETARVLADDLGKRVIIVDTSNEIAGDGDIPHPAIGSARRMQVRTPSAQHATMIEAVENHMPEVVVIDEIGTELEAAAARTIAERGVQLVGTAHGNTLQNLMLNPTLSDLAGGIQSVTLGDEEARRRGTQKSILERKAPPTFDIIVEIQSWDRVAIHPDVGETVDAQLRGWATTVEVREMDAEGKVTTTLEERGGGADVDGFAFGADEERAGPRARARRGVRAALPAVVAGPRTVPDVYGQPDLPFVGEPQARTASDTGLTRIYPFGLSRSRLEQAIKETQAPVKIVDNMADADTVFTLQSYFKRKPPALRDAEERNIPLSVLKSNAVSQIERMLVTLAPQSAHVPSTTRAHDPEFEALREAEEAIHDIRAGGELAVQLPPAPSYIRRKQHELAQRFNLSSVSRGREGRRGVRIFRDGGGQPFGRDRAT